MIIKEKKPDHFPLCMCCMCMKRDKIHFQDAFSFSKRKQKISQQSIYIPICQECTTAIEHGKKFWYAMFTWSCMGFLPLFIIGIQEPALLLPGFIILMFTIGFSWMKLILQNPIAITSQSMKFSNQKYQRLFDEADLIGQCIDGALFVLPQIEKKYNIQTGIIYDREH